MGRILTILLASSLLLCGCCRSQHFISNASFRNEVERDFAQRKSLLEETGVIHQMEGLETDEYEALMFLYAYMPIGDMVNFPTDYWLMNYEVTKKAMETMPWGKTIPERELRHFVLPVRVNNENLDVARLVFYEELAPLVKEMNMYDAVLEINHWCHSQAVYRPTDSRTCSPLTITKTAYGRCGEESTFLVAALRSVGIPARQVYTPRWAHTDDNHAWVEAWVDGKWYFLVPANPSLY